MDLLLAIILIVLAFLGELLEGCTWFVSKSKKNLRTTHV